MSDEIKKTAKAVEPVSVEVEEPAVGIVLPSGTVLSGTNAFNEPWFNVWAPQTFPGTVASGYAAPTLSGSGWTGQNNTGLVFQNDQYNTTWRGF